MKAEIGEYVRKRADALLDKARENPLQTAAIGIGVAYPLLKIVRSIPAPVLMVGAGVFLLGSSSGQKLTADVSRRAAAAGESVSASLGAATNAATKKAHDTRDLTSSTLASMQDTLASGVAGAKHHAASVGASLDQLQDAASGVVSFASDGLADLKHRTVDAVGAAANSLAAGVTEASSNFRDGASSAGESGTETVLALRDRALETSQKVSSGVSAIIQENPLLVGGLGLAVGMLIASALPRSGLENNIMGGASADVQRRANEFASKEFDAVKGLASNAIADLADHASQEGLLPADLNAAAEKFSASAFERSRKAPPMQCSAKPT